MIEVRFTEWTREGRLRNRSSSGSGRTSRLGEVVREGAGMTFGWKRSERLTSAVTGGPGQASIEIDGRNSG